MGVGEALGEDVQRKAGDHDGDAREQGLPPTTGEHAAASVGENVAPGGGGLGDAGADEGQRGLEDDGIGHEGHGEDHDGRDAVAQDVLDEDPRSLGTGNDDGTEHSPHHTQTRCSHGRYARSAACT